MTLRDFLEVIKKQYLNKESNLDELDSLFFNATKINESVYNNFEIKIKENTTIQHVYFKPYAYKIEVAIDLLEKFSTRERATNYKCVLKNIKVYDTDEVLIYEDGNIYE